MNRFGLTFLGLIALRTTGLADDTTRAAVPNPSPMTESTRKHERIVQKDYLGVSFKLEHSIPKPVDVFIPLKSEKSEAVDVLIHFHGADYVVQFAAEQYEGDIITGAVNLGSGSSAYNDPFVDSTVFGLLLDSLKSATEGRVNHKIKIKRVFLSGFSAGYGAIRRILSTPSNYDRVDGVLLLDGIHASYVPERTVIADGGRIDSSHLATFLSLAQDASQKDSRKRFVITHSEIFPGTYVSTTESTDYILRMIGVRRTALLAWGPLGMQQLSEAKVNHFLVMGFAGNAAQDHVDHLQALPYFLNLLSRL